MHRSHPAFDRAKDVLDGKPPELHELWPSGEPLFGPFEGLFVLASPRPATIAGGATGFERTSSATAGLGV